MWGCVYSWYPWIGMVCQRFLSRNRLQKPFAPLSPHPLEGGGGESGLAHATLHTHTTRLMTQQGDAHTHTTHTDINVHAMRIDAVDPTPTHPHP